MSQLNVRFLGHYPTTIYLLARAFLAFSGRMNINCLEVLDPRDNARFTVISDKQTSHSSNSVGVRRAMNHLKPGHTGSFRCFKVHSFRCTMQGAGAYLNNYPNFCSPFNTYYNQLSCLLDVEPRESRNGPKWLPSSAWPLCSSSHRALPDHHRTLYPGTLYVLHRSRYQICIVFLDNTSSFAHGAPLL